MNFRTMLVLSLGVLSAAVGATSLLPSDASAACVTASQPFPSGNSQVNQAQCTGDGIKGYGAGGRNNVGTKFVYAACENGTNVCADTNGAVTTGRNSAAVTVCTASATVSGGSASANCVSTATSWSMRAGFIVI